MLCHLKYSTYIIQQNEDVGLFNMVAFYRSNVQFYAKRTFISAQIYRAVTRGGTRDLLRHRIKFVAAVILKLVFASMVQFSPALRQFKS